MQRKSGGLSQAEAEKRLEKTGENLLAEKKGSGTAAMFFSQFRDVMILILAAAALASVLMGQGREAVTILLVMFVNALMGFLQEYRTEKTLQALRELAAPLARVMRDGKEQEIDARRVVPGDLLILQAGDRIAADADVESAVRLSCDESMLTGESLPAEKRVGDTVCMGCTVQSGHGTALVQKTGMATEMGKIADMMEQAQEEPTPLQLRLKQLGKIIAAGCVTICAAVIFLGYRQGNDFMTMLLTGISLAVAAIPEGLPAIVTVSLALSVNRILRRGAVIRRLHAVETLGCAGVICTDKTGTVTQNKMTVRCICLPGRKLEFSGAPDALSGKITENGRELKTADPDLQRLFQTGVLCSNAHLAEKDGTIQAAGNPTETAVLIAAARAGVTRQALERRCTVTGENPFDSRRKRMSVTVRENGKTRLLCKGAPDLLLPLCTRMLQNGAARPITVQDRKKILAACAQMAQDALRVLAFAESDTPEKGETELCFLGLAGMMDPPRPEVAGAVRRCRQAGIRPVMITGDSRETAAAVARETGILKNGDSVLTGSELDGMTDAQLAECCMRTAVYARVSPEHKLRIVRAYKAAGQIAAMTGDGVNDAPAVKEADIGIAMGTTGTDVTKQASGVVVLDDNFATIVAAVEEGRVIYENIRRFIRFLLMSNLGEVIGMLAGILIRLPVMLLPIQILLVNLFTDGLPAVALGLEPASENIMRKAPRPEKEGLFAHGMAKSIILRGILMGIASCWTCRTALQMTGNPVLARSACFLVVVFSQLVYLFECREKRFSFSGNPLLLAAAAVSAAGTLAVIYVPSLAPVFGMEPVTGKILAAAAAAVAAGPLCSAASRWLSGRKETDG